MHSMLPERFELTVIFDGLHAHTVFKSIFSPVNVLFKNTRKDWGPGVVKTHGGDVLGV